MRRRTVRTGLRLMTAAVSLLLLGTFYSQQINAAFSLSADGAFEFVKLAFFWGGLSGAAGIVIFILGLVRRSAAVEKFSLLPTVLLFMLVLALFFTLFYRSVSLPPAERPLRPGETLII